MASTLYSHASASFLLSPQGQRVGGCREKHSSLPFLTAANLTLNAHLQINSCGFGGDREREREGERGGGDKAVKQQIL